MKKTLSHRAALLWAAPFLLAVSAAAAPGVSGPCRSIIAEAESMQADGNDWANLAKYREANARLAPPSATEARVVFFGDSITEFWKLGDFFPGKPYVDRGISGQTTPQMRLRFCQDVVALRPAAALILAGTNDIAGNTGPATIEAIEGDLALFAGLAKSYGISVILASVLPTARYPWKPDVQPVEKIVALNSWLKSFAEKNGLTFLDYYSALADDQHGMRAGLSADGVHPNRAGYEVMAPLAQAAIDQALQGGK